MKLSAYPIVTSMASGDYIPILQSGNKNITRANLEASLTRFPILAPGSDTANLIQPSADWKSLILKASGTQTKPLLELQTNAGLSLVQMSGSGSSGNAADIRLPTNYPGKGSFGIATGSINEFGTPDPFMFVGYNFGVNGGPILAGENSLELGFEADYNNGSIRVMEFYLQYSSADGLTSFRPIWYQFNRATNAVTAAGISGDPLIISNIDGTQEVQFDKGTTHIRAAPATDTLVILDAVAGRGSAIQLSYNQAVVGQFAAITASMCEFSVNNKSIRFYANNVGGQIGAQMAVGVDDTSAVGLFNVSGHTAIKGVVVRGKSGQSGNLFEAQDFNATPLVVINPAGTFFPVQAVTGSAPAYVKGGMYFDTTLNKLRIGGATGWETVTSA